MNKLQKQEPNMNLWMDPLTIRPIQTVWELASNSTQDDGSGVLTTQTANLTTLQFWLRPRPEVTVQNRC